MRPRPSTTARAGASTTIVMPIAAVAVAMVSLFGQDGAFDPLTVVGALVGLLPWALVAGGVRVPPWLFFLLAVPPGLLIVVVAGNPGGMFPLMLVIVWLMLTSDTLWPAAIAAGASFAAIVDCTIQKGSADESGIVYFVGGIGIAWLSGMLLRRQEALTAQLEALRDTEVEQLAATERARIAREVHDVVAHSLTIVMLNLTGARRALSTDPRRADEALARAEVVGRDSLDSIRRVMGLLRDPSSGGDLAPPNLGGIAPLVDGYRSAGLVVALTMDLDAPLEGTVELVAYRVVQESLANVLQHAPGAAAQVVVARDRDGHRAGVRVTIGNGPAEDLPTAGVPRVGLGTRGMGERVRAVGGTFNAAPTHSGGWLVSAWLPARADVPAPARHV